MNLTLNACARLAPMLGPSGAARLFGSSASVLAPFIPSRRAVRFNRAFFGLPGADGERDAAVLGHFGAYLGEFLGAAGDPTRLREVVAVGDFAAVDEAAATGRGVAVVTPHFGNWEIGAWALGQHRPDSMLLMRTIGDAALDAAFRRARGPRPLLDVADGGRPLAAALKAGRIVAAAIDEPREHGIEVRFLGREVAFPSAFFRIVADTRTLVLPACCRRLSPGRIAVEVFGPVTAESPSATAQAVADAFSGWIREDPDQWMMLRKFA